MDELRKALETFALRNAEGEVSDAMLEKACEAYKVRSSEFVDDYQYNLYVAKSVYDHLHGVDQDPEISNGLDIIADFCTQNLDELMSSF